MTNPEPCCQYCGRTGGDLTRVSPYDGPPATWECSTRDQACLDGQSKVHESLEALSRSFGEGSAGHKVTLRSWWYACGEWRYYEG